MIKYGISINYLQDWTIQDAIREIYQNFLDYGEHEITLHDIYNADDYINIQFSNNWTPDNYNFLAIGESGKRNDNTTIGKHGEGLKMAMLVLTRYAKALNKSSDSLIYPSIYINRYYYKGTIYNDNFLGTCFGLSDGLPTNTDDFKIRFSVPKVEWEVFQKRQIKPEEVIHECYYGQLIDKNPGDIYVGGLYVCNVEKMKYAYNFKPEHIELDRDRKVPKSFDVEYKASKILENWGKIEFADLNYRDTEYLNNVPKKISNMFKPTIKNKKVVFETKSGDCANERIVNCLLNDPVQKKRVEKLKYTVSKKRTPPNILKEFFEAHKWSMNDNMKIDFNVIIKKSKDWNY